MDALVSEGTITLEYRENGSVNTRALDPTQGVTSLRAAAFTTAFLGRPPHRDDAPAGAEADPVLRNGDITVTVWGPCPQVYCVYQETEPTPFWRQAPPPALTAIAPSPTCRKWYDDIESTVIALHLRARNFLPENLKKYFLTFPLVKPSIMVK